MLTPKFVAVLLLLLLDAAAPQILSVHGSGTTNPSKCYWLIMKDMMQQSKLATHLTYRAVGSTGGQADFVNNFQAVASNDFGSGDIPLTKADYDGLTANGIGVVQLPVFLGAVSFFHNIPSSVNAPPVNLTSCILARIFTRDITEWRHPDVMDLNPNLVLDPPNLPITVARRDSGSSSTSSITSYLRETCPDIWPASMVGDVIETWPEDTLPCSGSSGMTTCITANPGAIGYIDSGHGLQAGLSEVWLQNKAGTWLNSQLAAENDGIAAAEDGRLPDAFDEDFSQVSLLNGDGKFTYPIVLITYIYVRKDLASINGPNEKSLLVAFLEALYQPEYVDVCLRDFGFTMPSEGVVIKAKAAIEQMIQLDTDSQEWFYESEVTDQAGMGDYVLSPYRKSIHDIELDTVGDSLEDLQVRVLQLEEVLRLSDKEIVEIREAMVSSQQMSSNGGSDFTSEDEQRIGAALILASLSFIMSFFMCGIVSYRFVTKT